jgi:hypothetical protein
MAIVLELNISLELSNLIKITEVCYSLGWITI